MFKLKKHKKKSDVEVISSSSNMGLRGKLKNIGWISLGVGTIGAFHVVKILIFVWQALIAVYLLSVAYNYFQGGRILLPLFIILIGIPFGVAIAFYFFPIVFGLSLISGLAWLVSSLFGYSLTFGAIFSSGWSFLLLFFAIGMAVFLIYMFVLYVKERNTKGFFNEMWIYIILTVLFSYWGVSNVASDMKNIDDNPVDIMTELSLEVSDKYKIYLDTTVASLDDIETNLGNRDIMGQMNDEEYNVISGVFLDMASRELTESDLSLFHETLTNYFDRIGAKLTISEVDLIDVTLNMIAEYRLELAKSLLATWDSGSYSPTQNYLDLHKIVSRLNAFPPEDIEETENTFLLAAAHSDKMMFMGTDEREFSRDFVLDTIKEAGLLVSNTGKVIAIYRDLLLVNTGGDPDENPFNLIETD